MMALLKTLLISTVLFLTIACFGLCVFFVLQFWLPKHTSLSYTNTTETFAEDRTQEEVAPPTIKEPVWPPPLATDIYNSKLLALAGFSSSTLQEKVQVVTPQGTTTKAKYTLTTSTSTNTTVEGSLWPTPNPYPYGNALLPFNRIVAYYGNFYSRYMGILGELPTDELITHLNETVAKWEMADPQTPVIPAIHYIAMVAQADAGADGMYRAVMPKTEIEKGYELAQEINGLLFLDIQIGLSTLEDEMFKFREYLIRPDVHFGIDPEFAMWGGHKPGTVIGSFDASDINYVIDYLADIVNEYQLPPKILVVHRFTQDMVTNYQDIRPRPEVQVVIDMDGWGSKDLKTGTYQNVIIPEPVEYAGIKIFYKNDLKPPSTGLFTPTEVLRFNPKPIYIQYQ